MPVALWFFHILYFCCFCCLRNFIIINNATINKYAVNVNISNINCNYFLYALLKCYNKVKVVSNFVCMSFIIISGIDILKIIAENIRIYAILYCTTLQEYASFLHMSISNCGGKYLTVNSWRVPLEQTKERESV